MKSESYLQGKLNKNERDMLKELESERIVKIELNKFKTNSEKSEEKLIN